LKNALKEITGFEWKKTWPAWLLNDKTNMQMELDLFMKSSTLAVAIEYNGYHHYWYPNRYHKTQADFDRQQYRDVLKQQLCEQRNIHLITLQSRASLEQELSEIVPVLTNLGVHVNNNRMTSGRE
jgi:hypothetical protein